MATGLFADPIGVPAVPEAVMAVQQLPVRLGLHLSIPNLGIWFSKLGRPAEVLLPVTEEAVANLP